MRNAFVLFVLILSLISPIWPQRHPVTLDHLVPPERQRALGLDDLTAQQREGLLKLLLEVYQLGVERAQLAASAATPSVTEARVEGAFEGWAGETIVKLMNGQIWQQTEYHYEYHYAFMPEVVIYKSGSGYKMSVKGVSKAVGVKRLR
jgi:hypothetical protein